MENIKNIVFYKDPFLGDFTIQDLIYFLENQYTRSKKLDQELSSYLKAKGISNKKINQLLSIADNTATITLPAYALDSEVTTLEGRVAANESKLTGIDSTVTAYVGTQVENAKTALIGTDDDEATADTIKGAKKYADNVAGDLTALEGRVDGLEGEIDANTGKLADVTTTVGAAIDSKINTAIGSNGSIETWADARFVQETEVSTIEDSEILALFSI